jgi:hypothetical protein
LLADRSVRAYPEARKLIRAGARSRVSVTGSPLSSAHRRAPQEFPCADGDGRVQSKVSAPSAHAQDARTHDLSHFSHHLHHLRCHAPMVAAPSLSRLSLDPRVLGLGGCMGVAVALPPGATRDARDGGGGPARRRRALPPDAMRRREHRPPVRARPRPRDGGQLRGDRVPGPLLRRHPVHRVLQEPVLAPDPGHLLRQRLPGRRRRPQA